MNKRFDQLAKRLLRAIYARAGVAQNQREVLREAAAELGRLPEDAWEREVAMPPLLALRIEIPQDSADAEEREYLMSTMELFEQWERKVKSEGREQGVKMGLVKLYRARFGTLPTAITAAIEAMHDPETLERWLDLFEVKSADEIAAALGILPARP